jgi:RNA 2',3'-cyclic 3'-phosphodiesterase
MKPFKPGADAMDTLFADIIPSAGASPRSPRHTLFFGLLPPVDVARRACDLAEGLIRSGEMTGALRPARVLHVSLVLVGKELAEPPALGLIESLRARGGGVRQRPFAVSLNRIQAWGRSGDAGPVVAVGDDGIFGVEALHLGLSEALGLAERGNFNPHMTLFYGRGPATPLRIPPITWTVRDFVLIHSLAGLTRYEVLDRFPLSAPA